MQDMIVPNDPSVTKRKQPSITNTLSKKRKIMTDEQQNIPADIQEVVMIPVENIQKEEVSIKLKAVRPHFSKLKRVV